MHAPKSQMPSKFGDTCATPGGRSVDACHDVRGELGAPAPLGGVPPPMGLPPPPVPPPPPLPAPHKMPHPSKQLRSEGSQPSPPSPWPSSPPHFSNRPQLPLMRTSNPD